MKKNLLYVHPTGKVIELKQVEKNYTQGTSPDTVVAVPDDTIDALARCLLPKIQAYFESPEGQAEFESWKRQKENN